MNAARALCAGLCCLTLLLAPRAAGAVDWINYRSLSGGFTVLLCGEPTNLTTQPLERVITHFILSKTSDVSCVVSYTDFPTDYAFDPESELLGTRDGLMRGAGAVLVTSRPFSYAVAPDRRVSALEFGAQAGSSTFRGILAVVERRLYSWTLIGPAAYAQSPDADRFLNSFQLVR